LEGPQGGNLGKVRSEVVEHKKGRERTCKRGEEDQGEGGLDALGM